MALTTPYLYAKGGPMPQILTPATTKTTPGKLERRIIITIDTLIELFKDFLPTEDMPDDVQPLKLYLKPGTRKIGILCCSSKWKEAPSSALVELPVKFELRRIYTVK